jgi:hypothetical protein
MPLIQAYDTNSRRACAYQEYRPSDRLALLRILSVTISGLNDGVKVGPRFAAAYGVKYGGTRLGPTVIAVEHALPDQSEFFSIRTSTAGA